MKHSLIGKYLADNFIIVHELDAKNYPEIWLKKTTVTALRPYKEHSFVYITGYQGGVLMVSESVEELARMLFA